MKISASKNLVIKLDLQNRIFRYLPETSGSQGTYCKINDKFGIKIFRRQPVSIAVEEILTLKKARKLVPKKHLVPRCYGLTFVKYTITWNNQAEIRPCIILEHIEKGFNSQIKPSDCDSVEQELFNYGISNTDIHCENMIKQGKKCIVVDWSPDFVSFRKAS